MPGYRPIRSEQIFLAQEIAKKNRWWYDIVVHHVLEDNYSECVVQIECKQRGDAGRKEEIIFRRVKL